MKTVLIIFISALYTINGQSNNKACIVPAYLTNSIQGCARGSTNIQNIRFFLANRINPNYNQIYLDSGINLEFYNTAIPACILINGWLQSSNASWVKFVKNQWIKNSDCNIIVVDWVCISVNYYTAATKDMELVGNYIAEMILSLSERKNLKLSDTIIFAHSIGAHVAGFCGKYINNLNTTQIGTIYASDPAAPCVTSPNLNPPNFRLVSTDAAYVQVHHCSSGVIGVNVPCGDADVYFNKGTNVQCGCGSRKEIDYITKYEPLCSHENCNLYFAYSLDPNNVFLAKQTTILKRNFVSLFTFTECDPRVEDFYDNSSTYMTVGIHGEKLNGIFRLPTTFDPPHCAQLSPNTCIPNSTIFSRAV